MSAGRAVDRKRVTRDDEDEIRDNKPSSNNKVAGIGTPRTVSGPQSQSQAQSATPSTNTPTMKKRPRLATKYDFADTAEAILNKFGKEPASLELHVYDTHYKFGTQEGVLPRNSPAIKEFLHYVARGEIAPAAVEVFRDSGIKFYEGCVILKITDHRNENHRGKVQRTTADAGTGTGGVSGGAARGASGGVAGAGAKAPVPVKEEQGNAKSYTVVLQPSTMSIWHDLLCMADTSHGRLTDQFTQLVESEILTLTTRNIDLRVPLLPSRTVMQEKKGRDLTNDLLRQKLHVKDESPQLSKKEAYKLLFNHRPEIPLVSRSLHEDDAHGRHGTEYEELMLIMDDRQNNTQGTANSSNQFMRLNFIEQLRKKRDRLRALQQQQQQHQQQQQQQHQAQVQAHQQQQGPHSVGQSNSGGPMNAAQRKQIPQGMAAKMTQAQLLRAQQLAAQQQGAAAQQNQGQNQNPSQMSPAQVQQSRVQANMANMANQPGAQRSPQPNARQSQGVLQRPMSQAVMDMPVGPGSAGGPGIPQTPQAQMQQRYANNTHVLQMQARAQAQMQKTQAKAAAAANMARLTPQQQQQLQRQMMSQQMSQQQQQKQQQQQRQQQVMNQSPQMAVGGSPNQQHPQSQFNKEQLLMLQQQQLKMQQQKNQMAMQSNFTVRPQGPQGQGQSQGQVQSGGGNGGPMQMGPNGPGKAQSMNMSRGTPVQAAASLNAHRSPSAGQAFAYSPSSGSPAQAASPMNQRAMPTPKQSARSLNQQAGGGSTGDGAGGGMGMNQMGQFNQFNQMDMSNMNMGNMGNMGGNVGVGAAMGNMGGMGGPSMGMGGMGNLNMANNNNMGNYNMDSMGGGGGDMGENNFMGSMNLDFGAMNAQMNMGSPQMQQQMLNQMGFGSPMMDNNNNRRNNR